MSKGAFIIFIIFLVSCQPRDSFRSESTLDMVAELDELRISAQQSSSYPYFTSQLLSDIERSIQGLPYVMKSGTWLDYVLVLMLNGAHQKCIQVTGRYLDANGRAMTMETLPFYKVLALAHLRKAEITNCVGDNSSSQSCIVPLKESGLHMVTEPAQSAMDIYLKLLAFDPTDVQSRWFLNLCFMALDQYPQGVPSGYLIPPSAFESDTVFKRFPNIAGRLGVATRNHAGGASLEDFNNDGYLDIFTTSYSLADESHLYLNDGNGSFTDRTKAAGIEGLVGGLNNIHADFNNDGWTDIFVMRGAWLGQNGKIPNSLLINREGIFSDETKKSGLYSLNPTGAVATADINLDGHLDLFVGNEGRRGMSCPSQLYVNNGDGTFTDMAAQLGIDVDTFVKGAAFGDINNNGLPDLYLSIYGGQNKLFVNRGGNSITDWVFEEIAQKSGVSQPSLSFTTWFWDYDQDGLQDIIVFGYDNRRAERIASEVTRDYLGESFRGELPRLYRNNGDETFTNATKEVGLDKLLYVMGANFGDLDNDGFPDMYLGTGEFNLWAAIPNRAFLNREGKTFMDVTTAGEFGQIQKGHAVAFGDIDNDGDQDLYHQVGGAAESDVFYNMLFENPGFGHHWISLDLEGTTSNRSAIGTRIEVEVIENGTTRTIYYWVNTGGSFGANSLRAEIGLGNAENIKELRIFWPGKTAMQRLFPEMDRLYQVKQE